MKAIASYIFWKNVYHNSILYSLAWLWFFAFNKYFRSHIRLELACMKVERQDEQRVFYSKMMLMIDDISKTLIHVTDYLKSHNP